MADKEVWNLGGPVVPAAGDRIGVGTGPLAGGYSVRGDFVYKTAAGNYFCNGSLGIGTATPGAKLEVAGAGGLAAMNLLETGVRNWSIRSGALASGSFDIADLTAGVSCISITSSANVGIGASAPGVKLEVANGDQSLSRVRIRNTGVGGQAWDLMAGLHNASQSNFSLYCATSGVTAMTVTSGGFVGIGTNAPGTPLHVVGGSGQFATFGNNNARGTGNSYFGITDASGRKAFVGYGASADNFHIMNEVAGQLGLGTNGVFRFIMDVTGNITPGSDNAQAFGWPSARWSVIYAATGTINTSDEREKKWRGALSDAEFDAGVRVLDELGFYQWIDAVDEKGARSARFHFGARAQRVWAIFADAKLIDPIKNGKPGATPYAFLCWDAWEEERRPIMKEKKVRKTRPVMVDSGKVGEDGAPIMVEKDEAYFETEMVDSGKTEVVRAAGDRFGLRVDQLALFLVACIDERSRREANAAADRIAALEAAIADLAKG